MDFKTYGIFISFLISILGIHASYEIGNSTAIPGPVPPMFGSTTIEKYCSDGRCHTTDVYNNTKSNTAPGNYIGGIPSYQSNKIGIKISQACITLIKHHIPNHCLGYNILKVVDNTNAVTSGEWINDTWYHRITTKYSYAFTFNSNPFIVMVDPDNKFQERARIITVEDQNFTWINPDDTANNTNTVQHVNRFISNPCTNAIVAPILSLVKDTITYLENGCKTTNFNDVKNIHRVEIPFSWNNPYASWHYSNYTQINATGGLGLKDCIHFKCKIKDPYANW